MTLNQCQVRHHEILVELDKMDELKERENREFTAEESTKYDNLMREDNRINGLMENMLTGKKLEEFRERKSKSAQLRELLQKCKNDRESYSEEMVDREAANATTILKDEVMSPSH